MWRWVTITIAALSICLCAEAQEQDVLGAILEFSGYPTPEEMGADEFERLEWLILHPLRINMVTSAKIEDSGLLTRYQTVCLLDHIARHGDVLSYTELSAIDGFGQEFVHRLKPFISLESNRMAGQRSSPARDVSHEIHIKVGTDVRESVRGTYALKYRIGYGDSLEGGIALSKSSSYSSSAPDAFSGGLLYCFRRYQTKMVIGSFNARFGQGLALWSGMSVGGMNKPSNYLKRSSTLSLSDSYTGNYSFKGIAAQSTFGRFRITSFTSIAKDKGQWGLMPAGNLAWFWSSGQMGLTHYAVFRTSVDGMYIPDMKSAVDLAMTAGGKDVFSEVVYDWGSSVFAGLTGITFPVGEDVRMAAMLRYYPASYNPEYSAAARSLTECSNECSASLSSEFKIGKWMKINGLDGFGASVRRMDGTLAIDAAYCPSPKAADAEVSMQIKSQAELRMMISESFAVKLRLTERIRTWGRPFRTDIRTDMLYYSRYFDSALRVNYLKCEQSSFLIYIEGICKIRFLKLCLRTGTFFVDDWDDRIYVYERDLPGSYNVPAFYGRGVWAALTGNWRFAKWGRLYFRTAFTEYPFDQQKKPGKAELKLMLKLDL